MTGNSDSKLLNKIGAILLEGSTLADGDTLLYSKVASMSVSSAVFRPVGNSVDYSDPSDELTWLLLWLWEEEADPSKRWAEMEYLIRDGRFTVTYVYPDEIDPDEDPFIRRDGIVAKYFGDKPIVYPPWEETGAQTFEL